MPTTIIEHIKGKDISETLLKKLHPNPETVYNLTISLTEIKKPAKNKWAQVVDRFEKESFLKGRSEEVTKHVREFRDNFSLRDSFKK